MHSDSLKVSTNYRTERGSAGFCSALVILSNDIRDIKPPASAVGGFLKTQSILEFIHSFYRKVVLTTS